MHGSAILLLKVRFYYQYSWKQLKYPNSNGAKFLSLIQVILLMNGEWNKRQNQNKTELLHMMFHGTTNNYKIKRKLSKCNYCFCILPCFKNFKLMLKEPSLGSQHSQIPPAKTFGNLYQNHILPIIFLVF